jgi:hypothetical protein
MTDDKTPKPDDGKKSDGGRRKEETQGDNLSKEQQGKDTNRTLEKPNN